jgi:hypothetical protein
VCGVCVRAYGVHVHSTGKYFAWTADYDDALLLHHAHRHGQAPGRRWAFEQAGRGSDHANSSARMPRQAEKRRKDGGKVGRSDRRNQNKHHQHHQHSNGSADADAVACGQADGQA